jgi:hypothetical protein
MYKLLKVVLTKEGGEWYENSINNCRFGFFGGSRSTGRY